MQALRERDSAAAGGRMRRVATFVALSGLAAAGPGCAWAALGYNSLRYRTTKSGECANVVARGAVAYGTLGEKGLEIVELQGRGQRRVLPPPAGSESVDDLALADGLLFALDARRPGRLAVFSLANPLAPVLASAPIEVEVGPFSGVSAGGGKVVVSGGTASLALHGYDGAGRLGARLGTTDLGRGQPDVLLAPDGRRGFVSTHYSGPHFGLTALGIGSGASPLANLGGIDLDTYGFTAGGAKPASFPIECALAGDVVLVAHAAGLAVVSTEGSGRPRLRTLVELPVRAVNVDVDGGAAAVVGSSPKPLLVLLDVTNPSSPVVKTSVSLPAGSYATSVAVTPSHVVVAAHARGLLVFQREGWSLRPERMSS